MKKIIMIMMLIALLLTGCTNSNESSNPTETSEQNAIQTEEATVESTQETIDTEDDAINQTLNDWVLGTEYGITRAVYNATECCVEVDISQEDYDRLQDYDFTDISAGINDILSAHNVNGETEILFTNGEFVTQKVQADATDEPADKAQESAETAVEQSYEGETVNLIFIHHSVGENWLNAGLNQMLNNNNIHVADTYYGWREMGDRTDTSDWPDWFNDDVMPTVYNELGNMTGYNSIESAPGENTIVMFKSCYPNSEVGSSIKDEQEIYLGLLDYFANHPDKMFVLVTPPPMQHISSPQKTRELANWLVSTNGWRKDYEGNNLFIFDFYNVLTAKDNHHMLEDGEEAHIINSSSNTLHYDSSGDDHPNDIGSIKAAEEFVPLLLHWYKIFSGE